MRIRIDHADTIEEVLKVFRGFLWFAKRNQKSGKNYIKQIRHLGYMKYKFFDHTADAKFRAYGKTIEEKFANAGVAMTAIMFNPKEIKNDIQKEINTSGKDMKQLLYNFLEELLFLMDTEKFILKSAEKLKITQNKKGFSLSGVLKGSRWKESYEQQGQVKAATYAEMEITDEYVQVVVDI